MIKAQLAEETNRNPKVFVQDDSYWAEQKVDGQRIILMVEDNKVSAFSRHGEEMAFNNLFIEAALSQGFNGKWVFDGEYLNDHYYVFDLLHTRKDEHLASRPLSERREWLTKLFLLIECPKMSLLPVAKTEDEKAELYLNTFYGGFEGVVFKDSSGRYKPESREWFKVKHYKTLDAVVIELNRGGKEEAVTLGLYDSAGNLHDVGGCKVSPWFMKDMIEGESVIEVRYLYATENDHLYIPTFSRLRLDKQPKECYTNQLRYTSKEVITKD